MSILKLSAVVMATLGPLFAPGLARAATEQPRYTMLQKSGVVELRQYGSRVAAETVVRGDEVSARNKGFQAIAGYIFGANQSRASIAMTAPVAQTPAKGQTIAMTAPVAQSAQGPEGWRVQFFMPAGYTLQTLPRPNNPEVTLVELPPQRFAVVRFSGLAGRGAVAAQTRALTSAVARAGWTVTGPPVVWFYDPTWTQPPLRRNEVAVPVAAEKPRPPAVRLFPNPAAIGRLVEFAGLQAGLDHLGVGRGAGGLDGHAVLGRGLAVERGAAFIDLVDCGLEHGVG